MAEFIWEMGIDWEAMQAVGGLSYLRTGLVSQGEIRMPSMNGNDTITFQIFDVTDGATTPQVKEIKSFVINTAPAIPSSETAGVPLSTLQPVFLTQPDLNPASSKAFLNVRRSWTSQATPVPVTVNIPKGRFLLTFQLEALGMDGTTRVFAHDPEMIIGEHG
jgi:hypothetical protein